MPPLVLANLFHNTGLARNACACAGHAADEPREPARCTSACRRRQVRAACEFQDEAARSLLLERPSAGRGSLRTAAADRHGAPHARATAHTRQPCTDRRHEACSA